MNGLKRFTVSGLVACLVGCCSPFLGVAAPSFGPTSAGAAESEVLYQNLRDRHGPWSIHVVRIPLKERQFGISTVHAGGRAVGLGPLTRQIALLDEAAGVPIAAINGDFYRRDGPYAGDPRGLQIMDSELISAPSGNGSFWLDAIGDPHITNTTSLFQVTWPDGSKTPFALNSATRSAGVTLYTSAVGATTRTSAGRELILERSGDGAWLPLRPGRTYRARVQEIRTSGNSRITPETMVLTIGPGLARSFPPVRPGSELFLSTATLPGLRGVRAAISGGPVIVQDGKRQRIRSTSDSYQSSSMTERHPRSAIGCNEDFVYLVEVDGRYRNVSVGMTLNELGDFMLQLGCKDALALDGGGSATLWFKGKIQNRPCDGYERPIANGLVVLDKTSANGNKAAGHDPAGADAAPDE